MKLIRRGCTRTVLLIGKYAVKIPTFYSHLHFLQGCYNNWSEREYSKRFKNMPEFYSKIAPSIFCSWFGLFQIQKRCEPKLEDLTEHEIEDFKNLHKGDYKKENFGYYEGRLVCLDYP